MLDLPWDDASFDIVTTFRGIWGTTPAAFDEAYRVLRPGGRLALTVWGDVSKSPGGWMLAPFTLAADEKVMNQAAMVSLGRPGVGEQALRDHGFEPEERFEVPFTLEFPDPEIYARGLAATGPAYEAIQNVGEEAFAASARDGAVPRIRDGLPLRGRIQVFGYIGTKPES
jgi:SAM-dependent methyltransferase